MKPSLLSINGVAYPFVSRDNYIAYIENASENARMANLRLTTEDRGSYWVIDYAYDRLPLAIYQHALANLRTAADITITFTPPDSDIPVTRAMRCTKWPRPSVAFASQGRPRWHTIAFTLEAVEAEPYA